MKDLLTDNLDNLLKINDELINTDKNFEAYLKNLEKRILDLDPKCDIQVNVKGSNYKIEDGISAFGWDDGRYPKKQKSISDILNKINEKYTQTFQNLKSKNDEYVKEDNNLKAKKKGYDEALTLMKYDYREIVKVNLDKMIETDYLCTMLCFIPVNQEKLIIYVQCYVSFQLIKKNILKKHILNYVMEWYYLAQHKELTKNKMIKYVYIELW